MKRTLIALPMVVTVSLLAGCSTFNAGLASEKHAPLYDGMGRHTRKVTTDSEVAQKYFDQGLTWTYAFNHDEAIRSFERAVQNDPQCAMAWWGIALCNGPHINNPVLPNDRAISAWNALQKAIEHKDNGTDQEKALINALTARYANPPPADRKALDIAYADAMAKVYRTYSNDSDVGTLYAEAMMDLRPWDLWQEDGRPHVRTEEILRVLEKVQRLDSANPGANHLYIHAVESSPYPERATAAANRLRRLVPASGHLVHMPSHIDVLTGRWALASRQNEMAITADRAYCKVSPKQGFYRLYMLHNHHMLAFASMMEGRSEVAIRAARQVLESVPEDFRRKNTAMVDAYSAATYDALKRFGRWDEIISEPAPPKYLPITTALWRCSRSVAFAAKGDVESAEKERAEFEKTVSTIPEDAVMAINPAHDVLNIARHFMNGEIAFRRGAIDESISELRKAVALEDDLTYMEPPEWVQPTRHTLGAVLLSAGRYREAEQVYREDLKRWPENGWSLYGLGRSLRSSGDVAEAKKIETRFRKAWERADSPIGSSCLCIPNT